jgi:hypothetical protein
MTTPHEIKFRLKQRLLALARDGGPVPVITGVHSITVEGNTVDRSSRRPVVLSSTSGPSWSAPTTFALSPSGWRGRTTGRRFTSSRPDLRVG